MSGPDEKRLERREFIRNAAAGTLLVALGGGLYFIRASLGLVYKPSIPQGWRVFAASIVQLGLLLTAAILDNLFLG